MHRGGGSDQPAVGHGDLGGVHRHHGVLLGDLHQAAGAHIAPERAHRLEVGCRWRLGEHGDVPCHEIAGEVGCHLPGEHRNHEVGSLRGEQRVEGAEGGHAPLALDLLAGIRPPCDDAGDPE